VVEYPSEWRIEVATVEVTEEVVHPGHPKANWHLALQRVAVTHSDGRKVDAYRFVCRQGLGKTDVREAHFPSLADAEVLIQEAKKAGWGNEKG
jgi:hypothetical protein